MHRIDTPTAQADKFGPGKNGFTGGNPQTGRLPTALDEDFFDAVQESICRVIESAGIELEKGNHDQLISALKDIFASKEVANSKQPLDATLTSLAGLATGANKLPYFTGIDTVAQTDLTSVGRDIISKDSLESVLAYLGLSDIAERLNDITGEAQLTLAPSPVLITRTKYLQADGSYLTLIKQVFRVSMAAGLSAQTFPFPVAFPTACLDLKSINSAAGGSQGVDFWSSTTRTNFTMVAVSSTSSAHTAYISAEGY